MHKMLNIEITKIDGTFWSQTGTDQSLRRLFIYFFEATHKCQFSDRNQCPIHEKKNYIGYNIFWDSRSDTFCGFKSFWSNLFRDSFVERKLWFILPFRQRQRICFTKRNVLTYFPIISRCWIENVIVSISWTCCFPKKSIYCCFVVFPMFLIEIEGEMLVLMLSSHRLLFLLLFCCFSKNPGFS